MRDTMGRWIDGLTDAERDMLVTARAMNDGTDWWTFEEQCGCLVGTVRRDVLGAPEWELHGEAMCQLEEHETQLDVPWQDAPASIRYPQAVDRFGVARVVRAVKARAARLNRLPAAPPARETVGVA